MPQSSGRALAYALLIWITGFVWGTVVFMTPALKGVSSIPYVSRYPLISLPLLLLWPFVAYLLARSYLKTTSGDLASEGLKLGLRFALVNFFLDLLVLVLLFKNGFRLLRLPDYLARLFHPAARPVVNRTFISFNNSRITAVDASN